MNKEQLNKMAHKAGQNVINLIKEMEPKIESAIADLEESAQEDGKDPVLTLGTLIKVNLTALTMVTSLSVSVKYKDEVSNEIEDPNQVQLPIGDEDEGEA